MRAEESVYLNVNNNKSNNNNLKEKLNPNNNYNLSENHYENNNEFDSDSNILLTYELAQSIKKFSVVDTLLNLSWVFFSPWYVLPAIFSITGYIGSFKYSINYLYVYIIFQLLYQIIRIPISINSWTNNTYNTFGLVMNIILTLICCLSTLYISRLAYKLIKQLKLLDSSKLEELNNIKQKNTKLIYL